MNYKNQFNFQKYFLLEFTRQLIDNTTTSEISRLKKILKEKEFFFKRNQEESEKSIIQDIIKAKERELLIVKEQSRKPVQQFKENISDRPLRNTRFSGRVLRIPETRLPQNLQYLKPVPVENISIDLGKLNLFLRDSAVEIIECSGADQEITVKGRMGTKPTEVKLTKDEIDEVINKFSKESKIPLTKGIYKVALGKLILSAIISDVVGSKFIISKMSQPSVPENQDRIMPGAMKF